jgi:lysozyme
VNIPKTLLIVALGVVGAVLGYRLARYVKMARYAVHGIDVSHYQRKVDWNRVEGRYAFVFLKATEGVSLEDRTFRRHWQRLGKLRIKRGAYHFFLPTADAVRQADHFIRHVRLRSGDLPPVLDVEVTGNVSSRAIAGGVRRWLERVERHYGVRPIVYTNASFYRQHLQRELAGYPVWIAQYGWRTPRTQPAWHFWQYADDGRVDGIAGAVDLNVFAGSLADLNRLCVP